MAGKYQPYPAYSSTGLEWLGDIPDGWTGVRLKNVTYINMGQSPNSDECNLDGNGRPFLQGNAEFGDKHPTPKNYCGTAKKVASEGQLLFSVRAPVGALNIADQEYGIGRGLCSIWPNSQMFLGFLWWVLLLAKSQLNSVSTGSTFEAVSAEQVGNCYLVMPPLPEQTQIAAFLDHETAKIDALIAKQERLIALLEEKRQAVISHAVTKGLNPDAPVKISGVEWVSEIPAHWRIVPLLAVSEVIDPNPSHRNPKYVDEGFPFISTQEFIGRDKIITDTPRRVSEKTVLEQEARCNFQVGSIVFSRKGTIGATRVLPTGVRLGILDSLCVINPVREILPEFLADTLTAYYVAAQYGPIVNGAALPQLSVGKVRSLKLILPPHDEQMQIARYLDDMLEKHDALISRAQSIIALLKERRTALISAAVTGKIDVRDWQPPKDISDQDTKQKAFA